MKTFIKVKTKQNIFKKNFKVHIFWEGRKILRNLPLTFVLCSASQKVKSKMEILKNFVTFSKYMNLFKLSFIANLLRKSAAFTVHIHSISTKVWAEFYSDYWSYFLRLHIYLTKNLVSSYLDFLSTFRLTIIKNIEVQISTFFSLWLKVWDPIWNQI